MYIAVCAMGRCLHQIINAVLLPVTFHIKHTQPFYGSFSGTTLVSQRQKKSSSGLYGASGEADTPTIWLGATPSRLISAPPGKIQPDIRYP